MERFIGQIALVVKDYDEALEYYTRVLGFELVEDTPLTPEKRWVVIRPAHATTRGCNLLLAKAVGPAQEQAVGNQSGGRVFLFLYTDNLQRDYERLLQNKVAIVRPPAAEEYGKVMVFRDLYGNLWDLIEPRHK